IESEANHYLVRVYLLEFTYVAMIVLGGILLFVLATLIGTRVLKPVPTDLHPVSSLLWEAFILYMFLEAAPVIPRQLFAPFRKLTIERSPGAAVALLLATDCISFLAVGYLAWQLRRRGLSLAEIGLHARQAARNVVWGIAAYMVTTPVLVATAWLTQRLTQRYFPNVPPPYHRGNGLLVGGHGFWLRVGLLVLLSVGAPLFEEFFFRGCLYGALRRRFGVAVGLPLSAAVFAILHPQLPLGFIPIFLLGFTFAALYEWRQSLVPSMVAHAINNGIIFVLLTALFPLSG